MHALITFIPFENLAVAPAKVNKPMVPSNPKKKSKSFRDSARQVGDSMQKPPEKPFQMDAPGFPRIIPKITLSQN